MDTTVMLCMLTSSAVFSWVFRKLGVSDVVGYILGGVAASAILIHAGIDVETGLIYGEPLRWLGLTLLSFTIGVSIGFRKIVENMHRVVAAELILYIVLWMASGFIAWMAGVGYVERTVLFIVLIDSSTVATVALVRGWSAVSEYARDSAFIQTSMEDLLQFILFTLVFAVGISVTLDLFKALVHVFIVVGLSTLLLTVARYLLKFLSRTKFIANRENKFVVAVGMAILFASVASAIGLPPLFGAFIAGISFSIFLSLDDISDMINGVKNLGLLLYFASLGAQLYLGILNLYRGLDLVFIGVVLGLIAFLSRMVGVFLAMLLTGNSISDSMSLALFLTPLSEMGIVFIDILKQRGIVSTIFVTEVTVAVTTTVLLFGIVIPRSINKVDRIEKLIPLRIANLFRYLSDLYMKRIDVAKSALTPIIRFTSASLFLTYIHSLAINIIERFQLPIILSIVLSIATSLAILLILITTFRNIFSVFLKYIAIPIGKMGEIFGKMLDLLVGGLAIVLQIHIFYEVLPKILIIEPTYAYITLVAGATLLTIMVYELIKYYFRISHRSHI
ncbi:MAG: cation:proton antiporter [Ignisphaera sp.]|uniref:Cation/H+ exchanger transmembrane domain-containing protein n=1 Tax=Ignisphaera aggregans TaxID=334771 RepID=A0A7J3I9S7_9CREN